jgi:hypothetical protein
MSPVIRRAVPTDVAELTRCQTACYREAFASVLAVGFVPDGDRMLTPEAVLLLRFIRP